MQWQVGRLQDAAKGLSERRGRQMLQVRLLGACQAATATATATGAQIQLLRCQHGGHLEKEWWDWVLSLGQV